MEIEEVLSILLHAIIFITVNLGVTWCEICISHCRSSLHFTWCSLLSMEQHDELRGDHTNTAALLMLLVFMHVCTQ